MHVKQEVTEICRQSVNKTKKHLHIIINSYINICRVLVYYNLHITYRVNEEINGPPIPSPWLDNIAGVYCNQIHAMHHFAADQLFWLELQITGVL